MTLVLWEVISDRFKRCQSILPFKTYELLNEFFVKHLLIRSRILLYLWLSLFLQIKQVWIWKRINALLYLIFIQFHLLFERDIHTTPLSGNYCVLVMLWLLLTLSLIFWFLCLTLIQTLFISGIWFLLKVSCSILDLIYFINNLLSTLWFLNHHWHNRFRVIELCQNIVWNSTRLGIDTIDRLFDTINLGLDIFSCHVVFVFNGDLFQTL